MDLYLKNLNPCFERKGDLTDIWDTNKTFSSSNKRYLIKAASGKGKTTLQKILHGSYASYQGDIILDGRPLSALDSDAIAKFRAEIASFVFQDLRLFPFLTAMQNVMAKNELTQFKSEKEIEGYFDALDMNDLIHRSCGEMSYGQQQRVAIIRSLCQPFLFLICDEPFSHLDDNNIQKACSLLEQELSDREASLIMLSLDHDYSFQYSEQIKL